MMHYSEPAAGVLAMKRYHFSLGNSKDGPIGYCAAVRAESKEEAVEILKQALLVEIKVFIEHPAVEHVEVYLNPAVVTTDDICMLSAPSA